ncbi:MAG: PilZ domain-containing protein [Candidatus Sulfotelmatobacter sp.]
MNSPQPQDRRQERRDVRYPLHMPVVLKMAHKEMQARSENISLRGILLSSAFPIPQGATVEVAVGVANLPDHGVQLNARGKVLRVQPETSGDFAVAIAFERPFELGLQASESGQARGKTARLPRMKNRVVTGRGLTLALAWHTET